MVDQINVSAFVTVKKKKAANQLKCLMCDYVRMPVQTLQIFTKLSLRDLGRL